METIPSSLRRAYQECQRQAFGHYENFPVASLLLPKRTRPHVAALYAFARAADDMADEDRFEGRRLQEIGLWERGLRRALSGGKAPEILQAFAHTLRTFRIPLSLPLALLKAFRMDAQGRRYPTWASLLYYCRHSADPVGRMVLLLHGIRDPKLHLHSDFICSGLQLINFWQDSSVDLARGRLYYPKEALKWAGVRERDLLSLKGSDRTKELVRSAVDFTEAHFQKGSPLLEQVTGRLGLELKATYLGGMGILNKIREMDYNVLRGRPHWSPWEKLGLALRACLGPVG